MIDITERFIRIKVAPKNRVYETYRYSEEKKPGLRFIYGITEDGKTEVASLHFDRKYWTPKQAVKWAEEHFGITKGKKDISKLIPKTIIDKRGRITVVYVRPDKETPSGKKETRREQLILTLKEKFNLNNIEASSTEALETLHELLNEFNKIDKFDGLGILDIKILSPEEIEAEWEEFGKQLTTNKLDWYMNCARYEKRVSILSPLHQRVQHSMVLGEPAPHNIFHEYVHFVFHASPTRAKKYIDFGEKISKFLLENKIFDKKVAIARKELSPAEYKEFQERVNPYLNNGEEFIAYFYGNYAQYKLGLPPTDPPALQKYFNLTPDEWREFEKSLHRT